LIAVTVYFGTIDQSVDNLKRNLLIERLSGDQVIDSWAPVIQPRLGVRHEATAIGWLRFELSEPRQNPWHALFLFNVVRSNLATSRSVDAMGCNRVEGL